MNTTIKTDFYDYTNLADARLFSVNEGLPAKDAITAAACLTAAIKNLAQAAGNDSELAKELPFAILFLSETVQALCNSLENVDWPAATEETPA